MAVAASWDPPLAPAFLPIAGGLPLLAVASGAHSAMLG